MSNRYGLPEFDLKAIRERDTRCVYCRKEMFEPSELVWRGDWATVEHLNHLPPWSNPRTVAICCGSCNSSRGKKTILEWFKSKYCKENNITPSTVAEPVHAYIKEYEGFKD